MKGYLQIGFTVIMQVFFIIMAYLDRGFFTLGGEWLAMPVICMFYHVGRIYIRVLTL